MQQHLSQSSSTESTAERRFTTASEPRIAARIIGDGEPVLFLHGVGSSSATWSRVFAGLDGRRLIAPDLRGHGSSEGVVDTVADFVADQLRLLDELGLERVHVVGFSLGAVIATAFAVAAPDRVASLVLLNSIAGRTEEERGRALERLEVIRASTARDVAEGSRERWFSPRFLDEHPDIAEEEVAIVSKTQSVPYAAAYQVLATTDLADDVAAITAPTLVITGEHDRGSTPRMSELLADRIAGADLIVVPVLRHYLHMEAAPYIAATIADFLDQHPLSRTAQHQPA